MAGSVLSTKFYEALGYAAELHAKQTRKGTEIPYVAHLLAVASLVLEHGGNEAEAIAALLHDAIEDQGNNGNTRHEIGAKFDTDVLAIVEACSDDLPGLPRGSESWRARKEAYQAHLAKAERSARLVSAADKLHNARSVLADLRVLGDRLWSRFNGGKASSIWNFRGLVDAFRAADVDNSMKRLIDELDRTVTEIELLARIGGTS